MSLIARHGRSKLRPSTTTRVWCGALLSLLLAGCYSPRDADLRREISTLREQLRAREHELATQKASLDELTSRLAIVRGISADDLKKIYYPERLVIDKISGGGSYNKEPGDDGVTVHLRPIDRDGDVIKVAGDIRIQLYDLAAPASETFIGEYFVPADQVGPLWHGQFLAGHFTIKCPWPKAPPKHSEITIRATFVDYFTQRVVTAQATCKVQLPASAGD